MTKLNHDRTVAVDPLRFWQPITAQTPLGVKMQLINRRSGVAVYGTLAAGNTWFTHWAPLPKFAPEDSTQAQMMLFPELEHVEPSTHCEAGDPAGADT
jgi:hypothetical protein